MWDMCPWPVPDQAMRSVSATPHHLPMIWHKYKHGLATKPVEFQTGSLHYAIKGTERSFHWEDQCGWRSSSGNNAKEIQEEKPFHLGVSFRQWCSSMPNKSKMLPKKDVASKGKKSKKKGQEAVPERHHPDNKHPVARPWAYMALSQFNSIQFKFFFWHQYNRSRGKKMVLRNTTPSFKHNPMCDNSSQ